MRWFHLTGLVVLLAVALGCKARSPLGPPGGNGGTGGGGVGTGGGSGEAGATGAAGAAAPFDAAVDVLRTDGDASPDAALSDASHDGDLRDASPDAGLRDASPDAGSSSAPSCDGLPTTCGPGHNANCCASGFIPGGPFNRSNDPSAPATVSDYRLDNYEITVGRFRRFAAVYSPDMLTNGAGKDPHGDDRGWDTGEQAFLPKDSAELVARLKCDPVATWTDVPGPNEDRPLNCLDWYSAFAFCAWDGGRLPTEAEWNYAAAGGAEQRLYPWSQSASDTAIDPTYASYMTTDCLQDGQPGCAMTDLLFVGSTSPKGDGRWGQSDLAGNVAEWTEDSFGSPYVVPCADCSNPWTFTAREVARGGAFNSAATVVTSSARASEIPSTGSPGPSALYASHGARCARLP